jgi:hypothetical protein
MKIPIFVSAPTSLDAQQKTTYSELMELLDYENLEPRRLGASDYPIDYPLKEVLLIARRCSGAVVLGFRQIVARDAVAKPWLQNSSVVKNAAFPTPWNQIEAGIVFALRLPLLVFREEGISGGVFDNGVTDVFLQHLPSGGFSAEQKQQARESIQHWVARVRIEYKRWD